MSRPWNCERVLYEPTWTQCSYLNGWGTSPHRSASTLWLGNKNDSALQRRQILEPNGLTLHLTSSGSLAKLLKPHCASIPSCIKWGSQKYLPHIYELINATFLEKCLECNPPLPQSILGPSWGRCQEYKALIDLYSRCFQDCAYSNFERRDNVSLWGTGYCLLQNSRFFKSYTLL